MSSFIDQIRERAANEPKAAAATLAQQIAERAGVTIDPVPPARALTGSESAAVPATQPQVPLIFGPTARSSHVSRRLTIPWAAFMQVLRDWQPHVGSITLAEYRRLKAGTPAEKREAAAAKDTRWYAPVRLAGTTREAAAVLEVGMLVLDFDSGLLAREQISQPLGDCEHLIISTCSHHPTAPRYRLHLPYTRSVSPAEHAQLFEHFAGLYPAGAVDTSARDTSRLWFGPSCWSDTIGLREFHAIKGSQFFDPDSVLAAPMSEDFSGEPGAEEFVEAGFDSTAPRLQDRAMARHANRALMPQPDEIRELLAAVRLRNGGSQRDPFLKIVRAVKDYGQMWADDELAWRLLDEWATTQRDYNGSENRRIWDSFTHLRGTTIGTLYRAAAGNDPDFDVDRAAPAWPAPPADPTQPFTSDEAALRHLTSRFPYIADQQGYLDRCTNAIVQRMSVDEQYQRWMPPGEVAPDGKRLPSKPPSHRLRYSRRVIAVSSLGYMPGIAGKYVDDNARSRWSLWQPPRSPWRLPATPEAQRVFTAVLDHILVQTGADGAASAQRYLDRIAWMLQNMHKRAPGVMLFVSGPQGTGKTTLSYEIPAALFGHWNVAKIGQKLLEGSFNAFYQHAQVVVFEEIALNHARDARKLYNELKDVLTSQTLRINAKYVQDYEIPNQTTIFATSNYTDAVALPEEDRRWDIIAVNERAPSSELMNEFYSMLRSAEGAALFRDILLSRDVSRYNPLERPPMTEAKARMIEETRDGLETDIEAAIESEGRDIGKIDTLQITLGGMPYYRKVTRAQLTRVLRRLGAQPLPSKLRVRTSGAKQIHPAPYWAWRNADVWVNATTTEAAAHVQTGAPGPTRPVRPVQSTAEET